MVFNFFEGKFKVPLNSLEVVAGDCGTGKTSFLLNFVKECQGLSLKTRFFSYDSPDVLKKRVSLLGLDLEDDVFEFTSKYPVDSLPLVSPEGDLARSLLKAKIDDIDIFIIDDMLGSSRENIILLKEISEKMGITIVITATERPGWITRPYSNYRLMIPRREKHSPDKLYGVLSNVRDFREGVFLFRLF